jgi:hypothetical protein
VHALLSAESCKANKRCAENHICDLRDDKCVAADCRYASECKDHGRCKNASDGKCVGDDASCSASDGCTAHGECAVDPASGSCVATKAGCNASTDCKDGGYCVFDKGDSLHSPECRATAELCKKSHLCAEMGDCWLVGDRCVPKTDADCKASSVCANAQLCKLRYAAGTGYCDQ